MRVQTYDGDPPPPHKRPEPGRLTFTPFRSVKLNRSRELRVDIATGLARHSVSVRMFRVRQDRSSVAGDPIHLFPEQLAEMIATLTEASALLAAMPPPVTPETE